MPSSWLNPVSLYEHYLRRTFTSSGLTLQSLQIDPHTQISFWAPPQPSPNPSLLLLHGFGPTPIWQWSHQVRFLSPHFNLYVPELIFFGASTTSSPERSEIFQAVSMAKLLEKLGVEKYSVAGTSYGGFVAYNLARLFGERVERVVIASSGVNKRLRDNVELLKRGKVEKIEDLMLPNCAKQLRSLMEVAMVNSPTYLPDFFLNLVVKVRLLLWLRISFWTAGALKLFAVRVFYNIFNEIRMTSEDQKESKLNWTIEMDNCMLGVFLEHLAQGRKTTQGWKRYTYNAIKDALKEHLNAYVTVNHIENRIKTWRKHTIAFKSLKTSFSGFGYDPETGCLTADELVWNDAIKANVKVKGYRNKSLPHLLEWMEVLGDNVAVGNIQKTPITVDDDANTEELANNVHTADTLLGDQYTFESPSENPTCDDNINNGTPTSSSVQSKKASKLLPRKRSHPSSGIKEEFTGMRCVIEHFVDAVKERNQFEKERIVNEKEKSQYDDKVWDQISKAIYDITDMDEDTQLEALDLFTSDHAENLKKCFLRVPSHKRKDWLNKKLKK